MYAFMAPLAHLGASDGVLYGVYVATATLIVLGAFWAGRSAVREDWLGLGMSIAIMLVAAGKCLRRTTRRVVERRRGPLRRTAGIQRRPGLAASRGPIRRMTVDTLDPLIHVPARLQIVATLAALPDGDALSFTRLQEMIGLTAGNLITHLRKLEDAGYLTSEKTGNGPASRTSVALTHRGRARPGRVRRRRCAACSTGCRHTAARQAPLMPPPGRAAQGDEPGEAIGARSRPCPGKS